MPQTPVRLKPTRAKRRPWADKPEPHKPTPHERVTKTRSAPPVAASTVMPPRRVKRPGVSDQLALFEVAS